jgi:aminoglycoside 6'-N-acetyltransferase I
MNLRPLTVADREAHIALREVLWDDGRDEHAAQLDELMPSPRFVAIGAWINAELVGFAEASLRDQVDGIDSSPAGYLEGIYVAPGHRRAGVAHALLAALMDWARGLGASEFGSDAELENSDSHAWHEAAGFEPIETVVRFGRRISTGPSTAAQRAA